MFDAVEFKSRVGSDGVLHLHLPLGDDVAGVDVVVTVRRISGVAGKPEADAAQWHRFVEETYGSCAGLGLEQQAQRASEKREVLE